MADDDLIIPPKSSAWTDAERETFDRPPPAAPGTTIPSWAEHFRVGEGFPLRGWNVRVVGHMLDEKTQEPIGFAIVVESMTAALKKRALAEAKRGGMHVVRR